MTTFEIVLASVLAYIVVGIITQSVTTKTHTSLDRDHIDTLVGLIIGWPLWCVVSFIEYIKDKRYEKRRQKRLQEQYESAPKTLEECFKALPRLIEDHVGRSRQTDVIERFKTDVEFASGVHFTVGMRLRNEWKLWVEGSPLNKWFNERGIFHPDDMSGIILKSFHNHLNDKPIDLDKQIEYYQKYWEDVEKGKSE